MNIGLTVGVALAILLSAPHAWGLGEPKYVSVDPSPGTFVLESNGNPAPLVEQGRLAGSVARRRLVGPSGQQVAVSVDWSRVPGDGAEGAITVSSGEATLMVYTLHAKKLPITRENAHGLVEKDGSLAIEAADSTSETGHDAGMHWTELPGYGETKSVITVFPVTSARQTNSKTSLQYSMYLYDSGDFDLQMTLPPTLNFVPGRGLRFAVSVDDGPRTIVDALEHNSEKDWEQAVSDGVRRVIVPLQIATPGYHTLKVWAVDPALGVERLVLSYGPLRPSYLGSPEAFHAGVSAGPR